MVNKKFNPERPMQSISQVLDYLNCGRAFLYREIIGRGLVRKTYVAGKPYLSTEDVVKLIEFKDKDPSPKEIRM